MQTTTTLSLSAARDQQPILRDLATTALQQAERLAPGHDRDAARSLAQRALAQANRLTDKKLRGKDRRFLATASEAHSGIARRIAAGVI